MKPFLGKNFSLCRILIVLALTVLSFPLLSCFLSRRYRSCDVYESVAAGIPQSLIPALCQLKYFKTVSSYFKKRSL